MIKFIEKPCTMCEHYHVCGIRDYPFIRNHAEKCRFYKEKL